MGGRQCCGLDQLHRYNAVGMHMQEGGSCHLGGGGSARVRPGLSCLELVTDTVHLHRVEKLVQLEGLLTTGVSGSSSPVCSSRGLGVGCCPPSPTLVLVSMAFLGFFFCFFFLLPAPADEAEIASGGAAEDMVSGHWSRPQASYASQNGWHWVDWIWRNRNRGLKSMAVLQTSLPSTGAYLYRGRSNKLSTVLGRLLAGVCLLQTLVEPNPWPPP